MTDRYALSLIVPTYNERPTLEPLISAVASTLADHRIAAEVIVVDDNSPDGTGDLADRLAARFPIEVVHREAKLGLGSAVVAGFARARADVLGVMDADLSHPPAALPGMLAALLDHDADMVVGSRYIPGGGASNWPWPRRVMSRLAGAMARPLTPVHDPTSGFFLIRRRAFEGTPVSCAGFKIGLELMVCGRIAKIVEFPFVFTDRVAGESKMSSREAIGYVRQLGTLAVRGRRERPPRAAHYRKVTAAEALTLPGFRSSWGV
jgi:dolichol-phosphate mannosyltransferase